MTTEAIQEKVVKRRKFWKGLKNFVAKSAPIVGSLLGTPAFGGKVGGMVADLLGVDEDNEDALRAKIMDSATAAKLLEFEEKHKFELEKMKIAATQAEAEADAAKYVAEQRALAKNSGHVNETMRAELASKHRFASNWRPLYGYQAGIGTFILILSVAYVMIFEPENMGAVAQAITALTPIFAMILSVLGVMTSKRTTEKSMDHGSYVQKPGLLQMIAGRIGAKNPKHESQPTHRD